MFGTVLASLLAILLMTGQTTVRFAFAGIDDEVTFDPARVSAAEVNRWIQLTPHSGPYTLLVTIESCVDDHSRYEWCGESRHSRDIHIAELRQKGIRERINDLDPRHYPPELRDVVLYLRHVQSFYLWTENRWLKFLKTDDVSVFESAFDDLNPKLECGAILDQIRTAKAPEDASRLARFDLDACMSKADRARIAPYPEQAWQAFLDAYGIHEHPIDVVDDDDPDDW